VLYHCSVFVKAVNSKKGAAGDVARLSSSLQEMLKEKKVPPFAKWDKELPKIFADARFKVSQLDVDPLVS
jgi:hypothetical protein